MAAKKKAKRVGSAPTRVKSAALPKAASARGAAAGKPGTPAAKSVMLPDKSAKSLKAEAKSAKAEAKSATPARKRAAPPGSGARTPGPAADTNTGAATEAAESLNTGDAAPSFDLPAETGARVSSRDLAGQPYVLYFYPKDDTPGCTTEACAFRDALPEFEKLGVRVLGVSPDSPATHERFRAKYELPFTLLSDADKQLSKAYGAWALKKNYGREYLGVVRSTFLIDSEGVLRNIWRGVKVNGHVEKVQAAAAALD